MTAKKTEKKSEAPGTSSLVFYPGFALNVKITKGIKNTMLAGPNEEVYLDPIKGKWLIYCEEPGQIALEPPCGQKYICHGESLRFLCTKILDAMKKAGV